MQTVSIRRISFVSLLKLCFIGFAVCLVPIMVVAALAAYFGHGSWTFNGQQLYGMDLLLNAAVCMFTIPVFLSVFFGAVIYIGQLVYGRFRPISIKMLVDQS